MKEFKGTKGEWIAHITEFPFAGRAYVRAKNDKGWINLLETNWISNFEEQKANAKLIASAPCLLEALQYIINDIKPEDACRGKFESFEKSKAYVGSKRLPTDEAILRCIEAIKKATE